MLTSLEIHGLRGFSSLQTLRFAIPNGNAGSGLTILVGANNAGKSTAVEALRAISQRQNPSFSQGRRNQVAGDQVFIRCVGSDGQETILKSLRSGGSETELINTNNGIDLSTLLVLPSRRIFNPYFSRSEMRRSDYMANMGFPPIRSGIVDSFAYRLFTIEKNRASFDSVLCQVLDPVPNWSIDQSDQGQYFLKVQKGTVTHSSEGMGEGLVSLLYIIDALYDSSPGDTIIIDEPELSLHPTLQRKLSRLFLKYTADRQIVVATHSPYFTSLDALPNGATIARIYVENEGSVISQLSITTAQEVRGLMDNRNNPHILGLNAQEIFFVEERVILVEGQEDVIFFEQVQNAIQTTLNGAFFGWGVGGADNMEKVAAILKDLGYSKVVGILDANRATLIDGLTTKFPNYHFFSIPANDVRTKQAASARQAVSGLLDDTNTSIRPEYEEQTRKLFQQANQYLCAETSN